MRHIERFLVVVILCPSETHRKKRRKITINTFSRCFLKRWMKFLKPRYRKLQVYTQALDSLAAHTAKVMRSFLPELGEQQVLNGWFILRRVVHGASEEEFPFFAYINSNHFNAFACGRCHMIQRLIFAYKQPNSKTDQILAETLPSCFFRRYLFSTQEKTCKYQKSSRNYETEPANEN